VLHALRGAIAGRADQMQVLYGAGGERTLLEYELSHLAGYEGSQPVRAGNAASTQFQLDVYGEVLDAMHQARVAGIEPNESAWQLERHLIGFVSDHWRRKDKGIWEVRGEARHFTHSKIMAWVAMDRAVRACEKFGLAGEVAAWRRVRDNIHREVCAKGFHAKRDSFVQSFDGDRLDASLLLIPLVGFLPPTDTRVRSTIRAIERELTVDGLVMRYHPAKSAKVDLLPAGEGAFLPCSFWLADCLNVIGQHAKARELFERLLALRNDLGLLSEEYDPHEKRLLGNFPQAFSHVALANTASNLGRKSGPAGRRGKCEP
jgi:GH15 family glucan-1,4-alpha-glucosidase